MCYFVYFHISNEPSSRQAARYQEEASLLIPPQSGEVFTPFSFARAKCK